MKKGGRPAAPGTTQVLALPPKMSTGGTNLPPGVQQLWGQEEGAMRAQATSPEAALQESRKMSSSGVHRPCGNGAQGRT